MRGAAIFDKISQSSIVLFIMGILFIIGGLVNTKKTDVVDGEDALIKTIENALGESGHKIFPVLMGICFIVFGILAL